MTVLSKFPCTQHELLVLCNSGWSSCSQNLEKFSSFRPEYTPQFIDAMLAEVKRVSAIPNRYQLAAQQDMARLELMKAHEAFLIVWQKLKLAVISIWPLSENKIHIKSLGQPFYEQSRRLRWEACIGLMEGGAKFISDHLATLEASDKLGTGFSAEFNAAAEALRSGHEKYLAIQKDSKAGSDTRMNACNNLYKLLMTMFADARIIFKHDPVLLKQFTFDSHLQMVSGQDGSGIKGSITNGQVAVSDIPDLLLTLAENGDEAFVDKDGSYRFSQLATGTFTLHVKATGYKEQNIPGIVVHTGSYTTRNIVLEPEVKG